MAHVETNSRKFTATIATFVRSRVSCEKVPPAGLHEAVSSREELATNHMVASGAEGLLVAQLFDRKTDDDQGEGSLPSFSPLRTSGMKIPMLHIRLPYQTS